VLGSRSDGADPDRTTRYLSLPPKGMLNSPAATGMGFWSVNPYIGCEFGCSYCYARETHRWTVERSANGANAPESAIEAAGMVPAEAFERRVFVKEGAAAVLERTLRRTKLGGSPILIGSATDPYQPAERRFGLTRSLLQMLMRFEGIRVGIITKSTLIARDATLLAELGSRHDVSVNISLSSVDAPLLRRLEPRTPVPAARLRAVRSLADAGVAVGLLVAPIMPGLTDSRPALHALLSAARDAGAGWADGTALRMGKATRSTLEDWLARNRPDLAIRYARHYGRGLTVSHAYAEALQARFASVRAEVGLPAKRQRRSAEPQLELWSDQVRNDGSA
jgi:DNA repair photolyase